MLPSKGPFLKGNPLPMSQLKVSFKTALLLWMAFLGIQSLASAQENDPGLIRALGTDSPTIENTYYLETTFDNDTSNYHDIALYGEAVFDLGSSWGLEANFPTLYTWDPLGK